MQLTKFFQSIIGLLVIVLIVFVGAKTRNALQEHDYIGKSGRDTISISGEGKVNAKPDVAQLSLGVITEGKTVQEAQKANTDKMNAITDAVKKMDIADKDLQTANYSISPKYDYTNGRQTIVGYIVSQNLDVKVRSMDRVGDVLAKAGELGANNVGGVQFTLDDPKSLEQQARLEAIEDARRKAEELGKQLGLTIVKVVTFSETGSPQPPVYPLAKAMEMDAAQNVPAPRIEAGSLDVMSNVLVTFEVR